jgi:iron complex outermembrane receptor protein
MRALAFIASILLATTTFAQSKSSITGRVVDDRGDSLPGANVLVEGSMLQSTRGDVTDQDGRYEVGGLESGKYRVTVSFVGYKTVSRSIRLTTDQLTFDATLLIDLLEHDQLIVSASRSPQKALNAPASVSVITGGEINDIPALNVAENVRSQPGIDFAKTGLVQNNVVARGFNNVFSGAFLTLLDNRIARVPSVRVNVNSFMPVTNQDVEQIEVGRGPGSALYGPNSANGVLHIITKSPFGSEGTTIGLGGGERSLRNVSFSTPHPSATRSESKYPGNTTKETIGNSSTRSKSQIEGATPGTTISINSLARRVWTCGQMTRRRSSSPRVSRRQSSLK